MSSGSPSLLRTSSFLSPFEVFTAPIFEILPPRVPRSMTPMHPERRRTVRATTTPAWRTCSSRFSVAEVGLDRARAEVVEDVEVVAHLVDPDPVADTRVSEVDLHREVVERAEDDVIASAARAVGPA